jgi:hypothetical protein
MRLMRHRLSPRDTTLVKFWRATDRCQQYELTLGRFYLLIKSGSAQICRSIVLTNPVRKAKTPVASDQNSSW